MPLNSAHEGLIHAFLDDYIELPTDPEKLKHEIAQINQAYNGPLLKLEETYSFIQRPTERLVNLEKHSKEQQSKDKKLDEKKDVPLKIGEVKLFVLGMINKSITQAAKDAKLKLTDDVWDSKKIESKIKSAPDYNQVFETQFKPVSDVRFPYSVPYQDEQLYKAWVSPNIEDPFANIDIVINIPSEKPFVTRLTNFRIIPNCSDKDKNVAEGKYINALNTIAKEALDPVNDFVRRYVYNHLMAINVMTPSETNRVSPGTLLLTYRYYYQALCDQIVDFSTLYKTNDMEFEALSHPGVIKLQENKKIDYARASRLSDSEINVLENERLSALVENELIDMETLTKLSELQRRVFSDKYYYSLYESGELTLSDFQSFTDEECKRFISAAAKNLLMMNLVRLNQVRNMTAGTEKIIQNEFYYQRLINKTLDYEVIEDINEQTADLLLLPNVIKLAGNNIRIIKDLIKLPPEAKNLIANDKVIQYLLIKELISVSDLLRIQHKIPSKPESKEFKSLDVKEIEKLKMIMSDCKQLISAGLIYDSDMHFLVDHCADIPMKKEMAGEKSEKNPMSLLQHGPMMRICKNNIKERLICLSLNTPVQFHDQPDSLQKLSKDCKQLQLSPTLEALKKEDLDTDILNYFHTINESNVQQIIIEAQRIGLTKFDVFEHMFGLRLKGIYDQLPYQFSLTHTDNLQKLQTEIHIVAKNVGIPAVKMQSLAVKYLLEALKTRLEQEVDFKKEETPRVYKEIYTELCCAEKRVSMTHDERQDDLWFKTFNNVVKMASLHLSVADIKQPELADKSKNNKRPASTLFLPKEPLISAKRTYEFCRRLELVKTFIPDKSVHVKSKPGMVKHA